MLIKEVALEPTHYIDITDNDPENTTGTINTYGGKIDFIANSKGMINEEVEELARFSSEFYIENAEQTPVVSGEGDLHKAINIAFEYASKQGYQVITYGTLDERYGEEATDIEYFFRSEGFKYVPNHSDLMFKDLTLKPGANINKSTMQKSRSEVITRLEKALKEAKATENRWVNIELFGHRFKSSREEIIDDLEFALLQVKDENNEVAAFNIAYEDFQFE